MTVETTTAAVCASCNRSVAVRKPGGDVVTHSHNRSVITTADGRILVRCRHCRADTCVRDLFADLFAA